MVIIIIDIVFIVVTFFLWNKYGKDCNLGTVQLEAYPPMELNSAEVGQIYKGYNENMDLVSLVLCLANKGYIKIDVIKEEVHTGTFKREARSFKISKLKEYDGTDEIEKAFFNELFSHNDEATWNDLYDNFSIKLMKIEKQCKEKHQENYEEDSLNYSLLVAGMILIVFIVCMFSSPLTGIVVEIIISPVLLPLLYFIYRIESIPKKIFLILLEIPVLLLCFMQGLAESTFTTIFNISIIAILSFFMGIMRKKTGYNTEIFAKIIGFKKFLKKASKEDLQKLTNENPEYFYNVLPYAYALGMGNKLIKKFDDIYLQSPKWFRGDLEYKVSKVNKDIKITFEQIYVAMITHQQNYA